MRYFSKVELVSDFYVFDSVTAESCYKEALVLLFNVFYNCNWTFIMHH